MRSLYKIPAITLSLLAVLAISCKDEEKSAGKEETVAASPSPEKMKEDMSKGATIKYNPAHGEAGHRCDIPVGAPLENANATTTPTMSTSPVRLQNGTTKINPPHGEPGHDCSVPVGAELKG